MYDQKLMVFPALSPTDALRRHRESEQYGANGPFLCRGGEHA